MACWLCDGTGIRPGEVGVCRICRGTGQALSAEELLARSDETHGNVRKYSTYKPDKHLPWEVVDQCRAEDDLQRQYPPSRGQEWFLQAAGQCPFCQKAAQDLAWIYIRVWKDGHVEQNGWITVCDDCRCQVNYFSRDNPGLTWEDIQLSLLLQNSPAMESLGFSEVLVARDNPPLSCAWPCPECDAPPDRLTWLFSSSRSVHGGSDGWYSLCDHCGVVVEYKITTMIVA